jgi:hypothetical protein
MNPYVDEVLEKKEVPKSHRRVVYWIKEGVSLLLAVRGVSLAVEQYLSTAA